MGTPLTAALCLSVFALGGLGQEPPTPPAVAGGEIIVKFRPQTEADQKVAAAAGSTGARTLSDFVVLLGDELRVPLEFRRLGSGGAIIVAVRAADLSETLAGRIRQQRTVRTVERVPSKKDAAGALRVEFEPGSDEANAVASAADAGPERAAAASALAATIGKVAGLAVTAAFDSDGRLLVTPALPELTQQVAARLMKRPDVQYAQPNYVVRPSLRGPR